MHVSEAKPAGIIRETTLEKCVKVAYQFNYFHDLFTHNLHTKDYPVI